MTLPYLTLPYHTIPYHTIPYHAMPCHAMPCHAMPCHAMPSLTLPWHINGKCQKKKSINKYRRCSNSQTSFKIIKALLNSLKFRPNRTCRIKSQKCEEMLRVCSRLHKNRCSPVLFSVEIHTALFSST